MPNSSTEGWNHYRGREFLIKFSIGRNPEPQMGLTNEGSFINPGLTLMVHFAAGSTPAVILMHMSMGAKLEAPNTYPQQNGSGSTIMHHPNLWCSLMISVRKLQQYMELCFFLRAQKSLCVCVSFLGLNA